LLFKIIHVFTKLSNLVGKHSSFEKRDLEGFIETLFSFKNTM